MAKLPAGSIKFPKGWKDHFFKTVRRPDGSVSSIQEYAGGEPHGLREEYDKAGHITGCWTVIAGERYLREPEARQARLGI